MKTITLADIPTKLSALPTEEQGDVISDRKVLDKKRGDAGYAEALTLSERERLRRARIRRATLALVQPGGAVSLGEHGPARPMFDSTPKKDPSEMLPAEIASLSADAILRDPDHALNPASRAIPLELRRDLALRDKAAEVDALAALGEEAANVALHYGGNVDAYLSGSKDDPAVLAFAKAQRLELGEAHRLWNLGEDGQAEFASAMTKHARELKTHDDRVEDLRRAADRLKAALGPEHAATKRAHGEYVTLRESRP